ncbi:hypothetical protein WR25_01839 [Diploscapter pachys]|uniref:Wiskott-Aldrich syndrome protein family member n=1 Tax=Diploscapter pachys TaxID=2018661 RepID=A0A2A2JD84_9BILA|nr:hypothetical protein WR25_01839 [Diploscapter pachys]
MPLVKRSISPSNVSRGTLPSNVQREELQCVANGTLANLIRQLSSLSKHAEHIAGEIFHEAMKLEHKSSTLQQRIERLTAKVSGLDINSDQARLEELHMRKAFKSSMLFDQHILDRSTLPTALSEKYATCDQPPNLDALNPYRESKESALSLYTNPAFFFDLWSKEILKGADIRRVKSPTDPNKSPKKKKTRPPAQQRQMQEADVPRQNANRYMNQLRNQPMGVFSFPEEYQAPQALGLQMNYNRQDIHMQQNYQMQPSSMVPPAGMSLQSQSHIVPPPSAAGSASAYSSSVNPTSIMMARQQRASNSPSRNLTDRSELPPPDLAILSIDDDDLPPPPPALMHSSIVQQIPSPPENAMQFVPSSEAQSIPPPPPPPPPNLMSNPLSAPNAATFASAAKPAATEGSNSTASNLPAPNAGRMNLLAEIRNGHKLRKVMMAEEAAAEKAATESHDVAAILKRRMVHVYGESSEEEEENDDAEWEEDD